MAQASLQLYNQGLTANRARQQQATPVNGGGKATFVNGGENVYTNSVRPTQGILGASTGGVSAPVGNNSAGVISNAPQIATPEQPNIDFDALIAPALAGLDAAESAARGSSSADVQSIESSRTSGIARTNQSISAQQGILDQTATKQNQNATNAEDQARRQYAEIQQGLQSRYGGTTGTGAFAGELAGRQTLQNIGQIKQGLSNVIQEIGTKKQQVEEVGRIALEDIEMNARDSLVKEKSNLETALAQIRSEKGQLQMWKAQKAAEAIQNYQSSVNQINANNTAFKQQLYVQQLTAQQKLDSALARGQEVAKSISMQDLTSLANQSTPAGLGFSVSGGYSNGQITDPRFQFATVKPEKKDNEIVNPFAQ